MLSVCVVSPGSGAGAVPAVDPLAPSDVSAWGEDHQEDHHDAEQDEGARPQGKVIQVPARQRPRYG